MKQSQVVNMRHRLWHLLNGTGPDVRFDSFAEVSCRQVNGARLSKLEFHGSHGETVPAYFLHPTRSDAPAVLYCHAHGARYDIGMEEFVAGRPALVRPYLEDFVALGWGALCVEMPTFGQRQSPNESQLSKIHLWRGTTLFGQMLAELVAGIDYLSQHPDINADRIATLGISMGGTHAWWLSALDPRVFAAVSMCCFSDLGHLIDTHAHDDHGHYMTVPGLLKLTTTGRLAGLAAPRAQLHCIGENDGFTPKDGFERACRDLQACYADAPDNVALFTAKEVGHQETEEMRECVLEFLTARLSANPSK